MTGPGGVKPIRVKSMRLRKDCPAELPKKSAATVVADESMTRGPDGKLKPEQVNIPRYRIYYLPWLATLAVFYVEAGEREPKSPPVMIPREWGTWEPAE